MRILDYANIMWVLSLVLITGCSQNTEINDEMNSIKLEQFSAELTKDLQQEDYEFSSSTYSDIIVETQGTGTRSSDIIVLASGNAEECEMFRNKTSDFGNNLFNMCIEKVATVTGDYSVCKRLPEELINDCYISVAIEHSSVLPCFEISHEGVFANLTSIYAGEADFTLCAGAAIAESPSEEMCELLGKTQDGNTIYRDSCFSSMAIDNNQLELCEKITMEEIKNACLDGKKP